MPGYPNRRPERNLLSNSEDHLRDNPQDNLQDDLPSSLPGCVRGREGLPVLYRDYGRSEDFSSNFHVGDVKASPFTAPTPFA